MQCGIFFNKGRVRKDPGAAYIKAVGYKLQYSLRGKRKLQIGPSLLH
jgi:hypothetical protein